MERFIKKVIAFIVIIFLCCFGVALFNFWVIGSQYEFNYQASLIDKVNRLESIEEPKIILVGNSNLSFGIDSKKIEDVLAMPVVNLGLHGGMGNAFHEEIAKLNIREGDIVVVCHSSFFDMDKIEDRNLAWITIDNNIEIVKILRPKDYLPMLKAYPDYLKNAVFLWLTQTGNRDTGGFYSRTAFNEYGDVVYKPEDGQVDVNTFFSKTEISVPEINDICINRLNQYNKYINDHGASMVVAGYPVAYGEYSTFDEKDFQIFNAKLEEMLECEIISEYTDYFYPYDYFYNTSLHLTKEGAEIRTEQLISDLNRWILNR